MSTAERQAEPLDETPDRYGAFPRLSEAQIERLAEHGSTSGVNHIARAVRGGEWADRAPLLLESSRRGVFRGRRRTKRVDQASRLGGG